MNFFEEFKNEAKEGMSKEELFKLKKKLVKKYRLANMPPDAEIFLRTKVRLVTSPVRTISGVAPLALMTKPFPCPHGKCLYCPGGPKSAFGDVPQSYTGLEPSTMRGIRNKYDPYLMVFNRLEQYLATGHTPDKTEIIVQGGTFPALPTEYQEEFITYSLKAMNDFGEMFYSDGINWDKFLEFFELPADIGDEDRQKRMQEKMLKLKGESRLEKEQLRNEKAKIRCVALCIETRPDWCFEKHIDQMLRLGTTRVEMGVQSLREETLTKTHRGHTIDDVKKATKLMRNSLLKVGYHMMPGLPGMTKEMDLEDYKELFENENYMPDAIKIYPTVVMKGTGLWEMWKSGKYNPLNAENMAGILVEAKKNIPEWCRIMRVQRDIPTTAIEAGPNMTNMRELVHAKMKKKGLRCKCIRCREPRKKEVDWDNVKMKREDYTANDGKEIFLSFVDKTNDILLGFLRLRILHETHRPELKGKTAGVREIHVYGKAAAIGKKGSVQHKGLGTKLMKEAEKIAKKEFGCEKMAVISGIGVKEYYYNLGYKKDGIYVSKEL